MAISLVGGSVAAGQFMGTGIGNGVAYTAGAGSNRIVEVRIYNGSSTFVVSGLTWGTTPATLLANVTEGSGGTAAQEWVFLVKEADIPVGAQTLWINGTNDNGAWFTAVTLAGVDQTDPAFDSAFDGSSTTTATPPAVTTDAGGYATAGAISDALVDFTVAREMDRVDRDGAIGPQRIAWHDDRWLDDLRGKLHADIRWAEGRPYPDLSGGGR